MWVLSEPVKSICESIERCHWEVTDGRDFVSLRHKQEDLELTFTKQVGGGLYASHTCDWMTEPEKRHLASFVKGWLPTYHRNRFMKLVKETDVQT